MKTTALITGATSGIGRAAADKLAQSGVHVIVVEANRVAEPGCYAMISPCANWPDQLVCRNHRGQHNVYCHEPLPCCQRL